MSVHADAVNLARRLSNRAENDLLQESLYGKFLLRGAFQKLGGIDGKSVKVSECCFQRSCFVRLMPMNHIKLKSTMKQSWCSESSEVLATSSCRKALPPTLFAGRAHGTFANGIFYLSTMFHGFPRHYYVEDDPRAHMGLLQAPWNLHFESNTAVQAVTEILRRRIRLILPRGTRSFFEPKPFPSMFSHSSHMQPLLLLLPLLLQMMTQSLCSIVKTWQPRFLPSRIFPLRARNTPKLWRLSWGEPPPRMMPPLPFKAWGLDRPLKLVLLVPRGKNIMLKFNVDTLVPKLLEKTPSDHLHKWMWETREEWNLVYERKGNG